MEQGIILTEQGILAPEQGIGLRTNFLTIRLDRYLRAERQPVGEALVPIPTDRAAD
jgi:hypothetical protein